MAVLRVVLLAWIFILTEGNLSVALPVYDDTAVKVAYLSQLMNFIDAPASKTNLGRPICVVGDNPFEKIKSHGKKLDTPIVEKDRDSNFTECGILYIGDSEGSALESILRAVKSRPILTVSDIKKFAKFGGMIGFTEFNGTIRLEINTGVLAASQFTIDQHLLEVALHVY